MYEKSSTQSNIVPPCWMVMGCLITQLAWVAPASAEQWVGKDKALHLAVSATLGGGAYGTLWIFSDKSGDPSWARLLIASSAALLPGVAKEIYDAGQSGNYFSAADLMWDLIGVSLGAGALYLIERFLVTPAGGVRVAGGPIRGGGRIALGWSF